jgi:hypothetical protein
MLHDEPRTGEKKIVVHRFHIRRSGQPFAESLNGCDQGVGSAVLGFHDDHQTAHVFYNLDVIRIVEDAADEH